jgi:hypothetical protein
METAQTPIFKNKRNATLVKPVRKSKEATARIRTMTPAEYADLRDVSVQLVCRALRHGNMNSKSLQGIKSFSAHGRFYLLTVDMELATPPIKKAVAKAAAAKK